MKKRFALWTLFSDDDDVCLFYTKAEALKTKKAWDKAGANEVRGPFEHFIDVEVSKKRLSHALTTTEIRLV